MVGMASYYHPVVPSSAIQATQGSAELVPNWHSNKYDLGQIKHRSLKHVLEARAHKSKETETGKGFNLRDKVAH